MAQGLGVDVAVPLKGWLVFHKAPDAHAPYVQETMREVKLPDNPYKTTMLPDDSIDCGWAILDVQLLSSPLSLPWYSFLMDCGTSSN